MSKIIRLIIFVTILNHCSFDKNSGIWTGSDKIVKLDEKKKENLELVFKSKDSTIKDQNFLKEETLKFDNSSVFKDWSQSNQNKFNNVGHVSFLNDGNYKKLSKISNSNINENILVYENNLFFSDHKGNIGVFSLNQNQLIFKFNFYKKKFKKAKKNINLIIYKESIIAADNFGYIYSINFKKKKLNWAKNYLVPFRSNLKIIDKTLFLSDEKNKIILVNIKDGKLIDELYTQPSRTVSKFKSNIAIDNNNNLLFLSTNGSLYSLNLLNRKTINWIQNFKSESEIIFEGNPVIVSNDKIILSSKKSISLINVNGARLWDLNIETNIQPIISGNTIFTVSKDNYLILINKNTGKVIYSKNISFLIQKDYKKNIFRKINNISHLYLTDNKLLLISNNSYFIELELKNVIKILSIKKNPFDISSEIIFLNKEMIFISDSKKVYKVN